MPPGELVSNVGPRRAVAAFPLLFRQALE